MITDDDLKEIVLELKAAIPDKKDLIEKVVFNTLIDQLNKRLKFNNFAYLKYETK